MSIDSTSGVLIETFVFGRRFCNQITVFCNQETDRPRTGPEDSRKSSLSSCCQMSKRPVGVAANGRVRRRDVASKKYRMERARFAHFKERADVPCDIRLGKYYEQ